MFGAPTRISPFARCTAAAFCVLFASETAHAAENTAPDAERIVGGEISRECTWPTTVALFDSLSPRCTGTLVHPRVVLYAAHCGPDIAEIHFGEQEGTSNAARVLVPESCGVNERYEVEGAVSGNDQAYCILSESDAVTDIPVVPILMGCEHEALRPGAEVTIVGFGLDDSNLAGVKREVTTSINIVTEDGDISVGGAGKDSCFGDSGGPVYIRLADNSWRVFGITSNGHQNECGWGGWYSMMHPRMTWLEGELKSKHSIDITPCHNADGLWNPGPDCREFPLDPGAGYGSWDNGCSGGPVGGLSQTCGPAFTGESQDREGPTVEIVAPTNARFSSDESSTVAVLVEASADDLYGIAGVGISLNGEAVPNSYDTIAPYEWEIEVPSGKHIVVASAWDLSGNRTNSTDFRVDVTATEFELPDATGLGVYDDARCGCTSSRNPLKSTFWLIASLVGIVGLRRRRLIVQ